MDFKTRYEEKKQWVEKNLIDLLPQLNPKSQTVYEAMQYSLNAGGKRIRPILLIAVNEFCGGNIEAATPFACAIEYIHTYSLIHDDLPSMDNDDYRRGKLSNHKVYGEATAILAGDGLLNLSMEIICNEIYNNIDDKTFKNKILAAREIFTASGINGMIGGQIADIEAEGKKVSKEHLDFIHINKTTALIKASVIAGAYIGGADAQLISDMSLFSKNLGLAFQITDDILDICGDEKLLGKALNSDIKLEKTTYPSLYGIEASKKKIKELHEVSFNIINQYEGTNFLKGLLMHLTDRVS